MLERISWIIYGGIILPLFLWDLSKCLADVDDEYISGGGSTHEMM